MARFTRLTPNFAHAWGVQDGKPLELCEKKYLNKNFTNAFTASVIFLMSHWIKPEPDLSYVHVVLLYNVFKSLFSDEHPRHIYWYGSPTPSSSHIGWTESKINKSDTRLVIFVSKFFKRQKLRRFFFNFQTCCRGWPSFVTVHAHKHATYRTCFLKTKKNAIPGKIWSVMARLLLREEENDE